MFGDNQFRYALLSLAACEAPLQLQIGGYRRGACLSDREATNQSRGRFSGLWVTVRRVLQLLSQAAF